MEDDHRVRELKPQRGRGPTAPKSIEPKSIAAALVAMTLSACGAGGGNETDAGTTAQPAASAVAGDAVSKSLRATATTAGKSDDEKTVTDSGTKDGAATSSASSTSPGTASGSSTVPAGRLLASNCFQCHGTNGVPSGGFDRLAGSSAREITGEMKEMAGKPDKGIMHVQALGYTDEQLALLAGYFAAQR